MMKFQKIGVIGAGAWGSALAHCIANAGGDVVLWSYEESVVSDICQTRQNTSYLPDIQLHDNVTAVADIVTALNTEAVLVVTPAQHMRGVLERYAQKIAIETPFLICSKGIEIKTGQLLSQVLSGLFPNNPIGVLSGPSFAVEAAKSLPTALTLAIPSEYEQLGYDLCQALSMPSFRLYLSDDIIGAQVGAAVKNVIAIACGISVGRQLGDNTRAALITRGLAEIKRLGVAMGADQQTFSGLSGVGDLVLTCNAMQSRNFSLGVKIGQGQSLEKILSARNTVSEGVHTAEAVVKLAERLNIDMPICRAVHETLSGRQGIDYAIKGLLERPIKAEQL